MTAQQARSSKATEDAVGAIVNLAANIGKDDDMLATFAAEVRKIIAAVTEPPPLPSLLERRILCAAALRILDPTDADDTAKYAEARITSTDFALHLIVTRVKALHDAAKVTT